MIMKRRSIKVLKLAIFILVGMALVVNLPLLKMDWSSLKTKDTHLDINSNSNHHNVQVMPPIVPQRDWQPATGSKYKCIVYSAYSIMDGSSPEVQIIAITKKSTVDTVRCKFHFSPHDNLEIDRMRKNEDDLLPGTIESLLTGPEFNAGTFIRCPMPSLLLRNGRTVQPEMVSVLLNGAVKPSNRIPIQYQNESPELPYQYNFSVCVKPTFNYDEDKLLPLLEWIEFYKLMGVQQFTLYNLTIGPKASCLLNEFVNGVDPSIKVNVLPWSNHHLLNETVLNHKVNVPKASLVAAQNDCIYRHRGRRSKYVVSVDLDEFIMPREEKAQNFQEMIDLLDKENRFKGQLQLPNGNIGEYEFRNAFFIMSRPDDPQLQERCSHFQEEDPMAHHICKESLMLRKTMREANLEPYRFRTKMIIKPEAVRLAYIHFVTQFERGYFPLKVSKDIGFSRHYRFFEESKRTVRDRISEGFGGKLVENLASKAKFLWNICNVKVNK